MLCIIQISVAISQCILGEKSHEKAKNVGKTTKHGRENHNRPGIKA